MFAFVPPTVALLAGLTLLCSECHAQDATSTFPSKAIRLVAPFAPGGPVDVGARILAPRLQDALGARVYVDNVAGGSGNIGTAAVVKAPGDGHTVLVISSTFVVNPSMLKLTYDIDKDLSAVSLVGVGPQVILVHPSVPARNMKELIDLAKASPGKYSYASAGAGSPGYLGGLMLNQAFNLDLQHVPFKGGAPAVTSTVGGHTSIVFTTIASAAGHIETGALRALATTGPRRSPFLPQIPTLAEQGIPNQQLEVILGVLVPSSTPSHIVERLSLEIAKIVAQPATKKQLAAIGFEAVGSTPGEFDQYLKVEIARWSKVIRDANIKPR
ncbi:MAG: Bug family tripartite tricarboxylate transporter substrate binding protein [Xanthobacteraceae bacterium]